MFAEIVHRYLRELMGPDAERVGSFLVSFDDHDAGLYRNYAVPDDDADPSPTDVTKLIAAFDVRNRTPRLEYLPGVCPAVEPALLAAGFVSEQHLPVLTCDPAKVSTPPTPPGITVTLAGSDAELRQVAEAQNDAYGQPETSEHDIDRLRKTVDRGGLVALAIDAQSGAGVGGGLCAPPHAGISELAAIGVRAAYRRRGIAAALTALLTRSCATTDITTPFLTPAGAAEQRIYQSVGYQPVATMLHISRPHDTNSMRPRVDSSTTMQER